MKKKSKTTEPKSYFYQLDDANAAGGAKAYAKLALGCAKELVKQHQIDVWPLPGAASFCWGDYTFKRQDDDSDNALWRRVTVRKDKRGLDQFEHGELKVKDYTDHWLAKRAGLEIWVSRTLVFGELPDEFSSRRRQRRHLQAARRLGGNRGTNKFKLVRVREGGYYMLLNVGIAVRGKPLTGQGGAHFPVRGDLQRRIPFADLKPKAGDPRNLLLRSDSARQMFEELLHESVCSLQRTTQQLERVATRLVTDRTVTRLPWASRRSGAFARAQKAKS